MSSFLEVPLHLVLALTLATQDPKGPDERPAFAPLFERIATRPISVPRISDTPSGPYLFTADAWFAVLRHAAPAPLAVRIFKTSSGRHYMAPGAERDRILSLRGDGDLAQALAQLAARRHHNIMSAAMGRNAIARRTVAGPSDRHGRGNSCRRGDRNETHTRRFWRCVAKIAQRCADLRRSSRPRPSPTPIAASSETPASHRVAHP